MPPGPPEGGGAISGLAEMVDFTACRPRTGEVPTLVSVGSP